MHVVCLVFRVKHFDLRHFSTQHYPQLFYTRPEVLYAMHTWERNPSLPAVDRHLLDGLGRTSRRLRRLGLQRKLKLTQQLPSEKGTYVY